MSFVAVHILSGTPKHPKELRSDQVCPKLLAPTRSTLRPCQSLHVQGYPGEPSFAPPCVPECQMVHCGVCRRGSNLGHSTCRLEQSHRGLRHLTASGITQTRFSKAMEPLHSENQSPTELPKNILESHRMRCTASRRSTTILVAMERPRTTKTNHSQPVASSVANVIGFHCDLLSAVLRDHVAPSAFSHGNAVCELRVSVFAVMSVTLIALRPAFKKAHHNYQGTVIPALRHGCFMLAEPPFPQRWLERLVDPEQTVIYLVLRSRLGLEGVDNIERGIGGVDVRADGGNWKLFEWHDARVDEDGRELES